MFPEDAGEGREVTELWDMGPARLKVKQSTRFCLKLGSRNPLRASGGGDSSRLLLPHSRSLCGGLMCSRSP